MKNASRRRWLLGAGGMVVLGAGCGTRPIRAANPDGTYCYEVGKRYHPKRTCTSEPIPAEEVAVDARSLEGVSDLLTVYIVRSSWTDVGTVVGVATTGRAPVEMVPESFARLRLLPGRHRLSLTWDEGYADLEIAGRAADTLLVEIRHRSWAGAQRFVLEAGSAREALPRVAALRLVADRQWASSVGQPSSR
jgi:hypothetical protein